MNTLDFAKEYKRIEVVMRQDKLLQLSKLPEFVQVWMINDKIESHVRQVHFLNHIVKLRPC